MMNTGPIGYLFEPDERIFWAYLVLSLVMALVLSLIERHKLPSLLQITEWLFDKDCILDIKYFIFIWLIKAFVIAPLMLSAQFVAMSTYRFASAWLTPIKHQYPYEWIVLVYTFSLFLISDFTRYWLHRWLHTNRILWAFHKVHHSPECLNPLTFYRIHPVENILYGLRYALSAGFVTGIFITFFGARFNLYTILGVNASTVIFSAVGANLRHSPVRLSYGRYLERIFISPAQHQIHHSTRHMHYNFGGHLAVWDGLFGSLKRNDEVPERLSMGLGHGQHNKYNTIKKMIIYPFMDNKRLLSRIIRRQSCKRSLHSPSVLVSAPQPALLHRWKTKLRSAPPN